MLRHFFLFGTPRFRLTCDRVRNKQRKRSNQSTLRRSSPKAYPANFSRGKNSHPYFEIIIHLLEGAEVYNKVHAGGCWECWRICWDVCWKIFFLLKMLEDVGRCWGNFVWNLTSSAITFPQLNTSCKTFTLTFLLSLLCNLLSHLQYQTWIAGYGV